MLAALSAHAMVLKKLGRRHDAIAFARQAAERFPENAVAWHNLGVSLNEIGAGEEAVTAFERARAGGLDVGETWSGYANALTIAGRGFASKVAASQDESFLASECVSCGACVQACPSDALIEKSLFPGGYHRADSGQA